MSGFFNSRAEPENVRMPLVDHLIELRRRFLWCLAVFLILFCLCYTISDTLYGFLVRPLAHIMEEVGGSHRMIYTALTEAFFTHMKVSLFGALVFGFPFVAFHAWRFIAPGLYLREKGVFLSALVTSPLLFLLGAVLVYYFFMPMAWTFLLGFQTNAEQTILPVQLEARVGEYLDLVMALILAFGLCFQLPILLVLLARMGIVSSSYLSDKRRYAVVFCFVVAAVVTPPDVISQIGLALPLLVLYECSIWLARFCETLRGNPDTSEDDSALCALPDGRGDPETDFNG